MVAPLLRLSVNEEKGECVSDEIRRLEEKALELLRLGYADVLHSDADVASIVNIGPQLDPPLQEGNFEDEEEFRRLASFLEGEGYIKDFAGGLLMFTLTREGRATARGEESRQAQITTTTHNYNIGRDAYSPVMGEQETVNISVSFDMRSVEVALDHADTKASQLTGADAERVNELLAELRVMLRSGEPVEPGRLSTYEDLVKKYGWLGGPVVSTLSNVAFRIIGG